jgi:hypothetical protein
VAVQELLFEMRVNRQRYFGHGKQTAKVGVGQAY